MSVPHPPLASDCTSGLESDYLGGDHEGRKRHRSTRPHAFTRFNILQTSLFHHVPTFLRSEGPYTHYNHFKLKGEDYHENSKLTKSNAKQRLQDQLNDLRQKREVEKKLFFDQIQTEEDNFKILQHLKRLQYIENQSIVKQ